MVFLPIVEREFRRATKRRHTYWVRMLAAVIAALVGVVAISNVDAWTTSAGVGRGLFRAVAGISFWLCLFVGVFTTSICLSEEKRHGTLGLLFLTDLKGYDVVSGKLANVSLNTTQTLMGILPVLALSMVLGGISGGEFWRMTLVLLNTLLFSLATGMFASALSVRPGRAMTATAALLVLFTAPSALVDYFAFAGLRQSGTDYLVPGVFQAYALAWDGRYQLPPHNFPPSILFTLALSVGQLGLASCILPRTFQLKVYPYGIAAWLRSWHLRPAPDLSALRQARRRMLRVNPVFWLQVRHRARWLYLWGFLALVIAAWLGVLAALGFTGQRLSFFAFMCLTPALHGVLKVAIAAAASNQLSEARHNGELESLLVTPLRTRRICRGHMLALQRQFALPFALVILIDGCLLLFGDHLIIEDDQQRVVRCLAIWAMMIMLIVDGHALIWVGLWEGLHSKNVFVATRKTLVRILFLPWPAFLLTSFLAPPVLIFSSALGDFSGWFLGVAIWWSVLGFMVDYFFYSRSVRNLREEFRTVAAEWFAPKSKRRQANLDGQPELWHPLSLRYR
jgi:hypothetical protein